MAARDAREDGTLNFLPHRLNRQPVIVRGLTSDELWICISGCAMAGLACGIVLAIAIGRIAMIPTMAVACAAAGVFLGGGALRRIKRGRPDTWISRRLQWWVSKHLPMLSRHFGAEPLIARSGYWTLRRGRK